MSFHTRVVRVAQWIARRTSNPEVVGSNPTVDEVFRIGLQIPLGLTL